MNKIVQFIVDGFNKKLTDISLESIILRYRRLGAQCTSCSSSSTLFTLLAVRLCRLGMQVVRNQDGVLWVVKTVVNGFQHTLV